MDHHRDLIPRIYRLSLLGFVLVIAAGCISFRPAARVPSSEAMAIEGVPLAQFGAQNCGAATLSAVLSYWGRDSSTEELDRALPKARNGGVLLLDMLLAAREHGFTAELRFGEPAILSSNIEAERPLILMLRVFDSIGHRRDLYHYVIADGFDPEGDLVRVQYGDGKAHWVSLARLSRSWEDTDFATLVIQPGKDDQPATHPLLYAVALEEAGRLEEAAAIYEKAVEAEPEALLAWVNLGNVEAARGRHVEAEAAYRQALEIDPDHVDALNNLAWLLLESGGDLDEARQLATSAVELGGPDPYLALDTLGRIELARGRCGEAIRALEKALDAAPETAAVKAEIRDALGQAQRQCGETR